VRRASEALRLERARRAPEPSFVSEYEQQPDLRFFRLGFALPLPVWDKRRGPIGEATAAVAQAEALLRERRLEFSSDLEAAYNQYLVADAQIKSFDAGARKAAQAALAAAQAAYKFGERSIMEVLDSQRVLHTVNADYLAAGYDRQAALIELQQLRAIQ
jgi:cobalt-zinc-cadmium efflux system outer membrane protein